MESKHQETRQGDAKDMPISNEEMDGTKDNLVQEEDRKTGVIKGDVYKTYWFAIGSCLTPLVLIALFFMQGS